MRKKPSHTALAVVRKYHPEVTTIVDARSEVTINVSKADCRNGKLQEPDNCAMAKALKREHDGAIISLSTAYIIDGTKATRFKVPESVAREIVSFDRTQLFAAGEYRLRPPTSTERLGPRNRPQNQKSRDPKRPHKKYHRTEGIRNLRSAED